MGREPIMHGSPIAAAVRCKEREVIGFDWGFSDDFLYSAGAKDDSGSFLGTGAWVTPSLISACVCGERVGLGAREQAPPIQWAPSARAPVA